ncbi:hypothetical protein ABW20_dc0109072 [Dactylellina cionopaga]|nr:hypothetical protein ABW20_dc0109072 [Dactylellina cionopaga]
MKRFQVFVAYYPKGEDIIVQTGGNDPSGEPEWADLRRAHLMVVDGWEGSDGAGQGLAVTPSTMRYTTAYPHLPIGPGHPTDQRFIKRWDPERSFFLINYEEFFASQDIPIENKGNKPPSFDLTEKQVMIDFARSIRQYIEDFITREILDRAVIVNDAPVVKWMVMYPDALDGIESQNGGAPKRDFISAFKDAGYPLDNSDIPPLPEDGEEEETEIYLADLSSVSRMVEFVSGGLAGLIGLAKLLPLNPHLPIVPRDRPFATVLDDQVFFSTRICLFTDQSRFGVVQQPYCSVTQSPIFQHLPEEHITLLLRMFAKSKGIDDEVEIINEIDFNKHPDIKNFVFRHLITEWPESPTWQDLMDILCKKLDKPYVDMITTDGQRLDGVSRKITTTSFEFSMMVSNAVILPTLETFGNVHMNAPSMTDVVIFDTGRGEGDAYQAIFDMMSVPKSFPRDEYIAVPSSGYHPGTYVAETNTQEPPSGSTEKVFIDGPDWGKLLDFVIKSELPNKEITEEMEAQLREISSRADKIDPDRYYRMRVVRPQTDGIYLHMGMCETISSEIARIFAEALRK